MKSIATTIIIKYELEIATITLHSVIKDDFQYKNNKKKANTSYEDRERERNAM